MENTECTYGTEFYSVQEFAEIFRVSDRAIRQAIVDGRVRAFKIGKSKKFPYRIPASELLRVQQQGIYIKDSEGKN
jgi:excisionase family DNA binding protein